MIMKALLAAFGLRALPSLYDTRVHDAKNQETAAISGFRVVARHTLKLANAIAEDPGDSERITATAARMRVDADNVQGMLAGLMKSMESDR